LINRDNDQFDFLEATASRVGVANIHSFGANVKADFRLVDYQGDNDGAVFWAAISGRTVEVSIAAPGRHIAENAIAVLAAATLAGADLDATVAAFAEVTAGQGRGQRLRLAIGDGSFTLIDESYNANPASMRAAIALLAGSAPGEGGRRIAVLGDMLEMGEFSAEVHAGLAEPLIAAGIDEIWIAGPDMAYLRDALQQAKEPIYRDSADELTAYALANIKPGDVVMVKSSNGSGFGRIVAALKEKFPPA
ncbi:MAG: UDP-N-acetylmuramoyl-tripeptide--D-alanyl-D-alanine ligase family protein, partial [Pseudomonadota bacterium]